jgi:hypothetical protein
MTAGIARATTKLSNANLAEVLACDGRWNPSVRDGERPYTGRSIPNPNYTAVDINPRRSASLAPKRRISRRLGNLITLPQHAAWKQGTGGYELICCDRMPQIGNVDGYLDVNKSAGALRPSSNSGRPLRPLASGAQRPCWNERLPNTVVQK